MRPVFARASFEGSLPMFCRNCGSKVEGGARFCPACGEPVAAEHEAPAESHTDYQSAPAAEARPTTPVPAKAKRSKKPLVIAAVVAALLAAGGGAGYYFGIYAPEQAREVAEQEALAAKHAVRFSVSAQGWDTSAGASRLPVHITGKEERGKKVDAARYVDSSGEGVELPPPQLQGGGRRLPHRGRRHGLRRPRRKAQPQAGREGRPRRRSSMRATWRWSRSRRPK